MGERITLSVSTWQQPMPAPGSPERQAVVDQVAVRVLRLGPGRLRVGIDGLTAAGKTTFGHEVARVISGRGRPVFRACLDDFKKPWRDRHLYDRESGEGYYRNAFDYPTLISALLEPCGPGGSGRAALCGIDPLTQVDHTSTLVDVPADAVLIVDGVFAFRPEIDRYWDFRVWVEVSAETSVQRGRDRDSVGWAGSEAEAVHRDRYVPAMRLYLAETDPLSRVDVVIDNTEFDRPRIRNRAS